MRTAEEMYPYLENDNDDIATRKYNQRQYDKRESYKLGAIEAIKECAEKAKSEWVRYGLQMGHQVDKQSILNLIKEVK